MLIYTINIYNLHFNYNITIYNNIFVNIVSPVPKKHHSEPAVFGYTCNNKAGPKIT